MRIKLTVENVDGDTEEVLAGLAVLRQWENANGKPAIPAIDQGYVGPLLELAALAYNRKHGRTLTVDEFADAWEVVKVDAGGGPADAHPSDPATAPPSA